MLAGKFSAYWTILSQSLTCYGPIRLLEPIHMFCNLIVGAIVYALYGILLIFPLSLTGANQRVLIIVFGEGSKVNIGCPILAMEATRRQDICYRMDFTSLSSSMCR